jgi:tetratricopeptide (TPR) repeat protein
VRRRTIRRVKGLSAGLLGGLVVLELLLQLAGVVVRNLDEQHKTAEGLSDHRVLALGACYTVGVGSEPHQSYPRQLEVLLDERHPALDLSVVNGGIRGKSIAYFADWIDAMLDDADPEVLIVNVNDRLTYSQADVVELETGSAGSRRRLDRVLAKLVIYRVARLALTPPPVETGLPEDWWGSGPGGDDGDDQLSHAISEAEAAVQADPDDTDAWTELARLSEKRLDPDRAIEAHEAAIALADGRPASHHHRQLVRIHAGQRHYAEAGRQLILARVATEGYQAILYGELKRTKRRVATDDPLEAMVYKLRLADYYALFGDLEEALRVLEEVLVQMPSMVQARDMLAFYRAVHAGGALPEQASIELDALFTKNQGEQGGAARFGVYAATLEDQPEVSAVQAEARFRTVLDHNLGAILRAADARGIQVVVENLSSLPAQAPIIAQVTAAYGVPLVDLQGAIAAHPDRAALLHPTMNLRLSADGNRFVAEQVYAALEAEGLLE